MTQKKLNNLHSIVVGTIRQNSKSGLCILGLTLSLEPIAVPLIRSPNNVLVKPIAVPLIRLPNNVSVYVNCLLVCLMTIIYLVIVYQKIKIFLSTVIICICPCVSYRKIQI